MPTYSNDYDTFKVELEKIDLNDEIEQYILDEIIETNYDEDGPDESFQINEIIPNYITVDAEIVWKKDYYMVHHTPNELSVTVKFEDDNDYYEADVIIAFKDLGNYKGSNIYYSFEPITKNWNSIRISNYGDIDTDW